LLNPPLLKFYILSVTDTFFEGKVTARTTSSGVMAGATGGDGSQRSVPCAQELSKKLNTKIA
jgi:hypothetical protein